MLIWCLDTSTNTNTRIRHHHHHHFISSFLFLSAVHRSRWLFLVSLTQVDFAYCRWIAACRLLSVSSLGVILLFRASERANERENIRAREHSARERENIRTFERENVRTRKNQSFFISVCKHHPSSGKASSISNCAKSRLMFNQFMLQSRDYVIISETGQ